MIQILSATFEQGVFKPDQRPALSESARVRLVVEPMTSDELRSRDEAWEMLERLWMKSTLDSNGDRLDRDQLHERR